MKVRTIVDHANPYNRQCGRRRGEEYSLPADEARAVIDAGLAEKVEAKK